MEVEILVGSENRACAKFGDMQEKKLETFRLGAIKKQKCTFFSEATTLELTIFNNKNVCMR
jgi:hypothetical protein